MRGYPGAKQAPGVAQRIVNLMPPHRVYIEAFAGSAAVFLAKERATWSVLIDLDYEVVRCLVRQFKPGFAGELIANHVGYATCDGRVGVLNRDAVQVLNGYPWQGDELVYCDPPYVQSTRSGGVLYQHEMTDEQHNSLLRALCRLSYHGARFILSGYRCEMYDTEAALQGWRRIDYEAMTRGGPRTESLWLNYEPPAAVRADYSHAGADYRERERIKRKVARYMAKFDAMPELQRRAILETLRQRGLL